MNNPANIGFVDAHSKSDGGANYLTFVIYEFILGFRTKFTVQTCVIGFGVNSNFLQFFGKFFRGFAAQTIDNTTFVRLVFYKIYDLFYPV